MWTFPPGYPAGPVGQGYNPGQGYPQMPHMSMQGYPQMGQGGYPTPGQGGFPQQGSLPAGYPYPPYMMPGYPPLPVPGEESGKAASEPATKGRKRRKKIPQGGPKKPATSFVLFSNTVREQVKEENPGLSFLDLGKKLGEMWREMEANARKEYEERANVAKERYLEEKKIWLAQRAAGMAGEN